MPAKTMGPFQEIAARLRRAARNGTRLHLDPEHARVLMQPRFYTVLAAAEGEEIQAAPPPELESVAAPVSAQVPTSSVLADLSTEEAALVSRAAERRLDEAAAKIIRRGRKRQP